MVRFDAYFTTVVFNWAKMMVSIVFIDFQGLSAMTIIYHNPRCGTSRTVLEALESGGHAPTIVEYLKTPLSAAQLRKLFSDAGLTARQAIREKEAIYTELGLDDPAVSDDQLIAAIAEHPILLNRPFVVTSKGTRLCRPATVVQEIL